MLHTILHWITFKTCSSLRQTETPCIEQWTNLLEAILAIAINI